MTEKNNVEIFGKEKEEIANRIKRIESALPQATMINGLPAAVWEGEGSIEERMKAFNVPGISIAVINNFELEWIKCFGVTEIILS